MTDREVRSFGGAVEVRKAADGPGVLVGYAARFDSLSEDLGGFREIIAPGAFGRAISEGHDVRALLNHDPNHVLGRSTSGTLRMVMDDSGLKVEVDVPDTQSGRDVVTLVRRGDISGMSFGFMVRDDEWATRDGVPLRTVRDLDLLDVSAVTYPAYPATHVSARAIDRARDICAVVAPVERLSRMSLLFDKL